VRQVPDDSVAHRVERAIFGNQNAIRYVVIKSAERIPDVPNGVVDLVADNMMITCIRRMCDWLVHKGRVRRHRARTDRRSVLVPVTAAGRQVTDQATARRR
jgi:hypothetical protein